MKIKIYFTDFTFFTEITQNNIEAHTRYFGFIHFRQGFPDYWLLL